MKDSTQAPESAPTASEDAEIAVAETVGRLMHFWGFKRPMGRIWSILYLSPEPLSAAQLGARLKMSAGAVSMALSELEKWGAITRSWVPGERRDYFLAESSIWKLVQRVVRERELTLVRGFGETLEKAESSLGQIADDASEDLKRKLSYKRDRLRHLSSLTQAGELLLNALVQGDAIDPGQLLRATPEDSSSSAPPAPTETS